MFLYEKIWVRQNPYVVIFYAVLVFVDTYSKGGSKTIGIINLRLLNKTFLYILHLRNDLLWKISSACLPFFSVLSCYTLIKNVQEEIAWNFSTKFKENGRNYEWFQGKCWKFQEGVFLKKYVWQADQVYIRLDLTEMIIWIFHFHYICLYLLSS